MEEEKSKGVEEEHGQSGASANVLLEKGMEKKEEVKEETSLDSPTGGVCGRVVVVAGGGGGQRRLNCGDGGLELNIPGEAIIKR